MDHLVSAEEKFTSNAIRLKQLSFWINVNFVSD